MLKIVPQRVCAFLLGALLTGCSSTPDLPAFTASGYLADRGLIPLQPDALAAAREALRARAPMPRPAS